jgi:transposase
MHLVINKAKHGKKIYSSILLRESYRENGKVKKRTIANLSACSTDEIAAIRLALENKNNLDDLINVRKDITLEEGLSIGAAWVICQVAKILGIDKALGNDFSGKLALWQVIARVLDQGSRLSAVRLARVHDVGNVLEMERGFNEDDLYDNLAWLSDKQEEIENRLFTFRCQTGKRELYLYDVTSSYLEGECNFYGAYGYNRDKKKGKKQIVIGLLCDELGDPLSVEVFPGNTQDIATFASQVKKVAERFGCERATLVGDRGMIKSVHIDNLPEGFHYITAITKPQIDSLLNHGVIQMDLFDSELCEVEEGGIRYILKRNPHRAQEISHNRDEKRSSVGKTLLERNEYLAGHSRANVIVAMKKVSDKIKQLKMDGWLSVAADDRTLSLSLAKDALQEKSRLDGCYVIKTNLPEEAANKETVHTRYKDLASVEHAFRTCKTDFLEVRPVFVRNEKSSRGHVFTVMLAYMIVRYLRHAWRDLDMTPEEGIKQLSTLSSMKMNVNGKGGCLKIPKPREQSRELIAALNIVMPTVLPDRKVNVDTKKKLTGRKILNLIS